MKHACHLIHPNDMVGTFYVAYDAFISQHCVFCCAWINNVFVPSHQLVWKLLAAARGGRTKEVMALLDQGTDIEATDEVRHVMFIPIAQRINPINVRIRLSRLEVHVIVVNV